MHRIGLALSGGGFRATLFHLGMIRFLREAGILSAVTHITSVSGGSILAAHLVLNWHRYTGTLLEFDAAAAEVIRVAQLDLRNRVLRRYFLALPLRALRRLTLRSPNRQLTRTGLLEYHYEKHLYGDSCLFQLPDRPRLYILATNLSEGCLCAFSRDGLLMQRRRRGQPFAFDRIHTGLATIPMAVTASSAFPGFFRRWNCKGKMLGPTPASSVASLSLMAVSTTIWAYACFATWSGRCWRERCSSVADDFADADHVGRALEAAMQSPEDTPLRRLAQMIALPRSAARLTAQSGDDRLNWLLQGLWEVMNYVNLAREPVFALLSPADSDVGLALDAARNTNSNIEPGEQMWLNRQLVEAAFQQATGEPCFRTPNAFFDAVLVSDAGKQFKISEGRSGGLVSTAMRATDIVMDRVWQLETNTFTGTAGFVFAPISKVVELSEDPTAAHPEIQRMAANIRTDLDRFSPLEIRTLIHHGYCVGRSACRGRPDLFGTISTSTPWDPLAPANAASLRPAQAEPLPIADGPTTVPETVLEAVQSRALTTISSDTPPDPLAPAGAAPASIQHGRTAVPEPTPETMQSRTLQQSARRRLWRTLLDYRDWVSFIYVPLLVPILIVLPYYGIKWHHEAQVAQQLMESVAQNNRDFAMMSKLLQEGSVASFVGTKAHVVPEMAPLDYSGFEVIADTRILDLRAWAADEHSNWYVYRRSRVRKLTSTANEFVIRSPPRPSIEARSLNNRIPADFRLHRDKVEGGKLFHVLDVAFDLSVLAVGEVVDLPVEYMFPQPPGQRLQTTRFSVDAKTEMFTGWLLLPAGKQLESVILLRYAIGKATSPERVVPANEMISDDGRMLSFTLLSVEPGFQYEYRWTYRE